MHVWNSDYARTSRRKPGVRFSLVDRPEMQVGVTEMNDKLDFFMPICKIDKEQRTISGYASTNCLDSDGEVVAQEAIKAALPDYMAFANIREMHRPWAVGVAQEANLDDRGLYVTAKVVDDNAWQKCLDQVYKGFSIGGKKQAKVGNTITKIALHEISIVDRPSNPECRFTVAKMQGGTLIEDDAVLVKVSDGNDKEPDEDEDDEKPKATKKAAKRAAKIAKRERAAKESAPSSSPTAHDAGGGAEAALGKFESRHELDLELTSQGGSGRFAKLLLQGEDTEIQSLRKQRKSKGRNMAEDNAGGNVALTKALIQLLGGGQLQTTNRPNPTLGLLKSAEDNMKAMKSHRREAEGCVENCSECTRMRLRRRPVVRSITRQPQLFEVPLFRNRLDEGALEIGARQPNESCRTCLGFWHRRGRRCWTLRTRSGRRSPAYLTGRNGQSSGVEDCKARRSSEGLCLAGSARGFAQSCSS
jgi:hypothetical protein